VVTLDTVRFLRRNTAESTAVEDKDAAAEDAAALARAHTAGKGRPTPKRREAEGRRRGPVPPPPRTTREALRRNRGTKEERKELAAKRKDARINQRQRMMAGDERMLPARERGPVKAYVRDLIDSRRNLLGLFMPLALIVVFAMFAPSIALRYYATLLCLVILVAMVLEAVLNGRKFTKLARAKFPKETISGLSIGWYTFSRSSQIRKLRIPKPRVSPGNKVSQ
jgi:hypothetical protein